MFLIGGIVIAYNLNQKADAQLRKVQSSIEIEPDPTETSIIPPDPLSRFRYWNAVEASILTET